MEEQHNEKKEIEKESIALSLSSTVEYQKIGLGAKNILGTADIKAPFYEPSNRAPINLVAVIDRSGSMEGAKLKLVKDTLNFLVTQLKSSDSFAMVTFESEVNTDLSFTKMNSDGKELAKKRISSIKSGGSTNLSGGLFQGLDLLPKVKNNKEVTSIFLLTDGLANAGVTSSEVLTNNLKVQMQENPDFTLFTFGYGSDHDDKLLKALSETGKGLYYFIENVDQVPKAFGDCMGGLASVVAQNIKLKFEPLSGTVIKKVNTKFTVVQTTSELGEDVYEVSIGDLYSEEERNVVVEIDIPEVSEEQTSKLIHLSMSYFNILTSLNDKTNSIMTIERVKDEGELIPNVEIDKHRNRMLAADSMEKANTLGKTNQLQEARAELEGTITRIQNSVSSTQNLCLQLVADLKEAKDRLVDQTSYTNTGSKFMSSHTMSHYYQRCSHTTPAYSTFSKTTTRDAYSDNVLGSDEEE